MPTENRFNNQTIDGVPRELLEDWLKTLSSRASVSAPVRKMRNELRALLDAPGQPKGEPTAKSQWDVSSNPVLGYADSYRAMARQGVEAVSIWSVITDLERNIAPLYTHPDSGEVERPREEVKRLDLMVAQPDYNYDADRQNFERELAERDALLREAYEELTSWDSLVARRVKAALPTSAEPKPRGEAVAEIVEFGKGLKEVAWRKGRMPELGAKLYAHPPAPVAVVLPERINPHKFPQGIYASGWNACLDEVTRLNTK